MEVFTLIKADIRKRKGIFLGFLLLSMLIVVSVMTMVGVRNNYDDAINAAFAKADRGVILGNFRYGVFTEEFEKKVLDSELVDSLDVYSSMIGKNVICGDRTDGNGYMVIKATEDILADNPKLEKGEIYLPYGLESKLGAKTGGKIKMDFLSGTKEFTIRRFVEEPFMGSSVIGYKTVFINDEEFDEIFDENLKLIKSEEDEWGNGKQVYVHPSEKANKSSDIMLRELNLETKFNDLATGAITREASEHYTGLFIKVILAVITGFAVLLLFIYLIIAGHNISSEVDIDYANLGILKSQGFTSRTIRSVYLIEYLFVELVGIILGTIVSIPTERWMSEVFFSLTAIRPLKNIPVKESVIFGLGLFIVTFLYILFFTRRISKVKPVKAITSGKDDFYFENRMNMPITKRGLGISMGFRQITSAPKRYISVFVVSVLLIFTVITAELMSGFIKSKKALESMGEPFTEINFAYKNMDSDVKVSDVEDIVKKYTDIEGRMYKSHIYLSINGETIMTVVKAYPDELSSVYEGREVKYDNEIVISESVSKLLDIHIGDTVTIGRRNNSADYVIVGIFQTMNDTGKAISMSLDGLTRLRDDPSDKYTVDQMGMYGIVLKDDSKTEQIAEEIKSKYGDVLKVEGQVFGKSDDDFTNDFYTAADGTGLLIYLLTFVFALVTVVMVCAKSFIQERTDIGVCKAIGFKVRNIRWQFSTRFAILSLISGLFAVLLARAFSYKILESVFAMFGIPHMELEYDFSTFAVPLVIFVIMYMLFGYIASRKVKKVSTRELITE